MKKKKSSSRSARPKKNVRVPQGSSPSSDEHPISAALERFIRDIDSLDTTLPLVMIVLQAAYQTEAKQFRKYLHEKCEDIKQHGDSVSVKVPIERYQEFINKRRSLQRMQMTSRTVPRSFLTSLVSHYDAFLGALLNACFMLRPETLSGSERVLKFSELAGFGSLEAAKASLVEKEVESVIRASHAEQFAWMEKRFDLPLQKDLPSWSKFVEVTERRNLFVHCNGVVSTQYLKVCREQRVLIGSTRVGEELHVSPEYFEESYQVIMEVGVKLAHVLWRKLRPDQRQTADSNLNEICLNLIRDGEYSIAKVLLDCANSQKKFASDSMRRVFVLNRAQAYKWAGDSKAAKEILDAEDWSACSEKYQLGVAVLRDEFDKASELMRNIGASGSPDKGDYKEWPLFREFRRFPQFADAYKGIFGESYLESRTEQDETQKKTGKEIEEQVVQ